MAIKEIEVKSIFSKSSLGSADYSVNPYVGCTHACKFCYAQFMNTLRGHSEPWGQYLDVKHWKPIAKPQKYAGKTIYIGTVCDPYQPAEQKYRRTRAFLEQMQDSGASLRILTRSDLILRDLDLLKSLPDVRVSFSIHSVNEGLTKTLEHSPSVARRLSAMEQVHKAGIECSCFIAPILPGLSNVREVLEAVQDKCSAMWLDKLNLRGENRAHIFAWIKEMHPDLLPLYQKIYLQNDKHYWDLLHEKVRDWCTKKGFTYLYGENVMPVGPGEKPIVVRLF